MKENALDNPCEKHSPFPKFVRKKTVALKDTCVLIMGQSPSSESYNINGEGLPFYQGNADFGEDNPTPRSWCTDPKKIAEKGNILISVRAPIGAINIANERCCIGRGIAAIRPNKDLMSTNYLRHQLSASRSKLEAMGTGSTFKAIGKKALSDFAVAIYPKSEQEAIEYQLDCVAAQIKAANNQLIRFDTLVKSRFVELFGDCTVRVSLGEVCFFKSGKTLPKEKEMPSGDYLYAKVGDLNLPGNERTIRFSRSYVDAATAKRCLIPKGAVVFPKRGGAIGTNKKRITGEDCCLDLNLMSVIPGEKIRTEYLLAWFEQMDLADIANGSTVPQINNKDLNPLTIALPKMELQQEFADFVAQVDKSRFIAQQQIEKLQMLYDSLAQEYFGD